MFWVFAGLVACFGIGTILGAPYLPVRKADSEAALDLAELKAGEVLIDLGSGDGRMLVAAARRGATAIGYEVNPLLWLWSWLVTRRYGKQVSVRLLSYWQVTLPPADVIYTFLLDRYMGRLDAKLTVEITRPTRVVSYVFKLPRRAERSTYNTHLYRYG